MRIASCRHRVGGRPLIRARIITFGARDAVEGGVGATGHQQACVCERRHHRNRAGSRHRARGYPAQLVGVIDLRGIRRRETRVVAAGHQDRSIGKYRCGVIGAGSVHGGKRRPEVRVDRIQLSTCVNVSPGKSTGDDDIPGQQIRRGVPGPWHGHHAAVAPCAGRRIVDFRRSGRLERVVRAADHEDLPGSQEHRCRSIPRGRERTGELPGVAGGIV